MTIVALKYGLVEDYAAKRKVKREWASRYDERLPNNDYDTAPAEDEWGNPIPRTEAESRPVAEERPQRSTLDPHDDAHYRARHDSYDSHSRGGGDDFSELPGAGDRVVRHQTGGAFNKVGAMVGGGKKKSGGRSGGDDRFSRMDAERDRAGYGPSTTANSDFDESWMGGGGGSGARGVASSTAPRSGSSADPLGAAPARQWKPTDDVPAHNF